MLRRLTTGDTWVFWSSHTWPGWVCGRLSLPQSSVRPVLGFYIDISVSDSPSQWEGGGLFCKSFLYFLYWSCLTHGIWHSATCKPLWLGHKRWLRKSIIFLWTKELAFMGPAHRDAWPASENGVWQLSSLPPKLAFPLGWMPCLRSSVLHRPPWVKCFK